MRPLRILIPTVLALAGLLTLLYSADSNDYFQTKYLDLTDEQRSIFTWHDGDSADRLMNRYRQHFSDTTFSFPRQPVATIKCFKNIPIIGAFTSQTLKEEFNQVFINFCNDTTNFSWHETTWSINESEYYIRLYNQDGKVIGKIHFCIKDCGMTSSRPFCPSMRFGGLSTVGQTKIIELLNDQTKWE